jgi:hypothetical protein
VECWEVEREGYEHEPSPYPSDECSANDWFASSLTYGVDQIDSQAERLQLWHKLRFLKPNDSSLNAFFDATSQARRIAHEFVSQKRTKTSWKKARQLTIGGQLPKNLSPDDTAVLSYKNCDAEVVSVLDDGTCMVKIIGAPASRQYKVSHSLLFDVRYISAHFRYTIY